MATTCTGIIQLISHVLEGYQAKRYTEAEAKVPLLSLLEHYSDPRIDVAGRPIISVEFSLKGHQAFAGNFGNLAGLHREHAIPMNYTAKEMLATVTPGTAIGMVNAAVGLYLSQTLHQAIMLPDEHAKLNKTAGFKQNMPANWKDPFERYHVNGLALVGVTLPEAANFWNLLDNAEKIARKSAGVKLRKSKQPRRNG